MARNQFYSSQSSALQKRNGRIHYTVYCKPKLVLSGFHNKTWLYYKIILSKTNKNNPLTLSCPSPDLEKASVVSGSRAKAGDISHSYTQLSMRTHWPSTLLRTCVCVCNGTHSRNQINYCPWRWIR